MRYNAEVSGAERSERILKETSTVKVTGDDPSLRWGAYWLHPDGWYRLYPFVDQTPNAGVTGA